MSRSSSIDVVNTITIVSRSAVKDINEVTDMPSAVSLTTTPQVATSPPHSRITENSDSAPDTPDSSTTCSWCGRTGGSWEPGSSLSCTGGITSNAGRFCSEACFAAGRRAAFKRARTCDWCRHLRHSVSYVDFQDGENQLQFCSDKCLNQYKMNIFCRETQAYLALHGLTSISPASNQSIGDGLITPELWLRDCQSPQSSSLDDEALVVDDEPMNWSSDCGLDNEERERLASRNNSLIQNSPLQMPNNNKQIKSEDKDSEDSSVQDFQEETIKLAIKESLKDEEYRRCKARKEEMDSFKSFSVCVESRIPPSNLPTNNTTVKTCRRSKSSPESLKASPPHSDSLRKGTIFIKDVRKLLRRDPEKGHNSIHRTQCRISSNNTITTHNSPTATSKLPVSFHLPQMTPPQSLTRESFPTLHQSFTPPHQIPSRFNLNSGNTSIPSMSSPNIGMRPRIPVNSFSTKTPPTNSQFSLLPPVTVVVPYPIPIPIPLPIPIPQSVFEKFFNSKNSSKQTTEKENDTSSNIENPTVPQDLSQRSKLKNGQSSNCCSEQNHSIKSDKLSTLSDSSTSSSTSVSPALTTKQPSFSSFITDNPKATSVLPVLPFTSSNDNHEQRSLRKRKHLASESQGEIDLRLKRKNKFVPV